MNKNKKFIVIILLFISIGFAFLSSNLSILGSTVIRNNKWNIYFNNVVNIKGEDLATEAPTTTGTTTTDISYNVTLSKPGDIYKFNVDIVNDGTIDAMVKVITNTDLTEEQKKYINYSITYVDEAPLEKKNFLGHGESETLAVTVEYKKDIAEEDLKAEDEEITVKLHLEYEQADNTKVTREPHKLTVKYDWNYNFVKNGDFTDGMNDWINVNSEINIDNDITYNGKPSMHIFASTEDWSGIQNVNLERGIFYPKGHSYTIHTCFYIDSTHQLGGVNQKIRSYISFMGDNAAGTGGLGADNSSYVNDNLKEKSWVCLDKIFKIPAFTSNYSNGRLRIDSGNEKQTNNYWVANVQLRIVDNEEYDYNIAIETLPTPTREGYTFNGWYTDPFGGTLVENGVKVTESTTYFAHWTKI